MALFTKNYDPVVELGVAQVTVREDIHQVHYGVHPVVKMALNKFL